MDGQIIDIRGHRTQYRCAFEGSILQARDVFVRFLGPWAVWVMAGIGLLVTGVVIRMWGTKRNK